MPDKKIIIKSFILYSPKYGIKFLDTIQAYLFSTQKSTKHPMWVIHMNN